MLGRDPEQEHRQATPLELLFDLTFVVSFAQAGNEAAHLLADGHVWSALLGFTISAVAICWAWITFSWFSSGFDTDDWVFRVMTLVQMLGVLVFALGIPDVFHSVQPGEPVDIRIAVAGYVVMRTAMVAQWLRAARDEPRHRGASLAHTGSTLFAQAGWVALALARPDGAALFVGATVLLFGVELTGPVVASRRRGGIPWHADHIAERYGLLVIITVGEGILGTIAAVTAAVEHVGWNSQTLLLGIAGVGLTFALWWSYFVVPFGPLLQRHRGRAWGFGYGHIALFASIAAIGAGLHAAAYAVQGEARIGVVGAVLAVAVPVMVFTVASFAVQAGLVRALDPLHLLLCAGTAAVLALSVALAANGVPLGWCLLVTVLAPTTIVVGRENLEHRRAAAGGVSG
ncbi:low temperature requirement protein A [Kineococcus vitellinus]|uniref:low temperature requirement protein A n=1 Tax=Kineococcus vitellinus TaxID=2696565 RepID=UPI00196BADF1|nr:low temperature requirement protein A [Kineococcus vitellinus]